jgi:hypothetical protein
MRLADQTPFEAPQRWLAGSFSPAGAPSIGTQ